jgi:hypothetical protein
MSAMDDIALDGVPIALRDGSHVRIRQGRPSDRELLLRGFRRLSPESRYRRFLTAMPRLPEATVRQLTDLDHHDREAMLALDEQGTEALGVARYVRDPKRPDAWGPGSTETLAYALVLGAVFGAVCGALVHTALSGGRRDFISATRIKADRYDLEVDEDSAGEAERLLGLAGTMRPDRGA